MTALAALSVEACLIDWDALEAPESASGGSGPVGTGGTTNTGGDGGMGGAGASGGMGGAGAWWDTGYQTRRTVTFDNSAQTDSLADFPVLVALAAADVAGAQAAGEDLRFVDADDSTQLAHEIELFDPAGTSLVWVRVPLIDGSSASDFIYMYYGNSAASDGQDAASTWSSYAAVWHLSSGLLDSTANGNDGTDNGSMPAAGQVAGGHDIVTGGASHIACGTDASLDGLFTNGGTVEAWIRPTGWGGNQLGRIVDKSTTNAAANGWSFMLNNTSGTATFAFMRGHANTRGHWRAPNNSVALDTWHHVVATYTDGVEPILYVDGAPQMVTVVAAPGGAIQDDMGVEVWLGNNPAGNVRNFQGTLDEVRLSASARSADWIAAQYLSMTGAFVTVGAEETAP
jgi:hypothetical protein